MSGIYQTIQKMQHEGALLVYTGEVNPDTISRLLQLTEDKLDDGELSPSVRKRVFHILVECLQNLFHHTEPLLVPDFSAPTREAVVRLRADNEAFYVETGNYLSEANVIKLKNHLSHINELDKEQVRAFYKSIMSQNGFTEKGGAGLGFIDIARKSEEPLQFEFIPVAENLYFFEFVVKIKL